MIDNDETILVSFRCPKRLYERLGEGAQATRRTRSSLLRFLVEDGLESIEARSAGRLRDVEQGLDARK